MMQHLFNTDRELFEGIFECLIVASYLNTKGEATHDYQVNEKVIFLFDETNEESIKELCNKNILLLQSLKNMKKKKTTIFGISKNYY